MQFDTEAVLSLPRHLVALHLDPHAMRNLGGVRSPEASGAYTAGWAVETMIVDHAIISDEPADNFSAIETFYASVGYLGLIAPSSIVIAARDGDVIVGAARIARENGILVLRGMMIAPSHQRRGLGTRMLWALDKHIGRGQCFCVPHGWLQNFYGQIGFATITDDFSPSHLRERLKAGRIKKPQLMRRPENLTK